ncbi:sulfurtransferase complex subunit TusC [Photobacterium sp. DNB23_23_1]|uniref:Protein TusC homolog n=1 Tax=Photobacterium pectinilyticum TaxID=2906793 RepID=A0ABT1MWF6_9GAMM|nr:sulfurtransferase complex subunit TusC [Photobacterium sp. ZSDE20]MCQ1056827.1 sulfurtransferase complex subunit TusC [Photobacterium sp. ZSDE20]MDD1820786.1 sulfurtransferase complex subunit TusC [Photobacterium sp. ZSDE20]
MTTLGFVFRHAPHGIASGREGLDAVLATSAYSEDISLFFHGDGVYQLLDGQQPQGILSRDYIVTFKMLELYDIEQVYVCRQSLQTRGLTAGDLLIDVIECEPAVFSEHLHTCQRVLTF